MQHKQSLHKSTCCYCGVGCGILVRKDRKGSVTVEGDPDYPVNKGMLCSKGINLHHTVNDRSDRLLYPQLRYHRSLPLQRVNWEQAMDRAAAVFSTFIKKYGPDSVAFYISGQCLTEEYYVINKLVKGFIGTNNIDTNSRLCMSSAVAAYKMSLGEDIVPVCYDDIELSDCIFVTGANPAWCHPILWRRVEAHKAANPDVRIIIADPRITDSCSIADLHLQIDPGADIELHHAIGRILIEEGRIDKSFITQHTERFDVYREKVFERSVRDYSQACGIPESELRHAARLIGNAKAFLSMWTMGLNQSAVGVNKNLSLINLHLITGQIGKPGAGPFSLTGQPNAMGGREVGGLSNMLPAHRDLNNENHRKEIQEFWKGKDISPNPGLTATEMFDALDSGKLKAIWIICTNPLVSLPNIRKVETALSKAKFVVVQEMSAQVETLKFADLVLPAATWLEKEGTMTNSERRISYLPKLLEAPGEALPDAEIINMFARKMGFKEFDFRSVNDIYKEHVSITKGTNIELDKLDHEEIERNRSVQWPYKNGVSGKRMFTDHKFFTYSGKAILHAVPFHSPVEKVSNEYPYILTTGRVRDQWHTMSRSGKVSKLKKHSPGSYLEMNPVDAKRSCITENDLVVVRSARGDVRVPVKISATIKKGVVFLPMHWGRLAGDDLNRTNNLTSDVVDPISKEPDFKYCVVNVSRYRKNFQRIVIIGAGAGAYGFVSAYRRLNTEDQITVFSGENFPFYNRVMLPHYISGTQQWHQLVKMKDEEESSFGIRLIRGVSVTTINRDDKYVVDSEGQATPYDVLILATGSRAAIPANVPQLEGIFTMRSRIDADRFIHFVPKNGHVVIVGGGLLGLEMAASLRSVGAKITIIQRISRLLDRQLDSMGSMLLHEEMIEQGCEIFYNDEVQQFYGQHKLTAIKLRSGTFIECDALIIAIGTVPNIELARESGIECQRGVIVNERMQTSDPSIFAIGEIAEYKSFLYGITAAAEEQAAIVARNLFGDISSLYEGSLLMNIIKIHGFDLCSMGIPESPNDSEYEEIIFLDRSQRYYKKCIIHNDRLVGAILIGDKTEFNEFRELIAGKVELSEKRIQLLRAGIRAEPVLGSIVCSCNNVGAGNIENAMEMGCRDLTEICKKTGAGTGCGSCKPAIQRMLEQKHIPWEEGIRI